MERYRLKKVSRVKWGWEREYFEEMRPCKHGEWVKWEDALDAVAEAYERCARIAEDMAEEGGWNSGGVAEKIAVAIREEKP